MADNLFSNIVLTSPGKVRMACRIWEPQPIKKRPEQEETFTYNRNTATAMGGSIDSLDTSVAGATTAGGGGTRTIADSSNALTLRERYVYWDTFLEIKGKPLSVDATWFKGFKAEALYTGVGANAIPIETCPWIYHQTFALAGSLFSKEVFDPFASTSTDPALSNGLSRWQYRALPISDEPLPANGRTNISDFDSTGTADAAYSEWRRTHRFQPMQIAVPLTVQSSSSSSSDSSTSSNPPTKPIHWLAIKKEPLANGQDFWVEFARGAVYSSTHSNTAPLEMHEDYAELDANKNTTENINGETIYRNAAVISFTSDGSPNEADKLDLSKQPYYCIEINHADQADNYWIIIPWNSKPIFVHRGKVPTVTPTTAERGPRIVTPTESVSRRLSTFEIPGRQLMMEDYLRITVRNQDGRLKIVFRGYEDKPWIIERNDYDADAFATDNTVIADKPVPVVVKPAPIQIGAGNILCGFTFAPLIYAETAMVDIPESVSVSGEASVEDIQLTLEDRGTQTIGSQAVPLFSQRADVFVGFNGGTPGATRQLDVIPPESSQLSMMTGYNGSATRSMQTDPTAARPSDEAGHVSFVRIAPVGPVISNAEQFPGGDSSSSSSSSSEPATGSQFRARYELGAGDMTLGEGVRRWTIPSAVSPRANGWRLKVKQSDTASHDVCPVEVAQHITNFSCTASFTDNIRVERSGSIKFQINFGAMTGTPWANPDSNAAQGESGNDAPPPAEGEPADDDDDSERVDSGCTYYDVGNRRSYMTDQTKILANLSGKTFPIRIYAWWEGGFMECKDNACPCKANGNITQGGADHRIVFTGLCHGGQITVENGKRYMECQLLDYWKILQDQKWANSPMYDGVRDFNAVRDILRQAGFASVPDRASLRRPDPYPPAEFITRCTSGQTTRPVRGQSASGSAAGTPTSTFSISDVAGELFVLSDYGLPSSFNILESPLLKFKTGSAYDESIVQIATRGGKIAYFDRFGIFKLVTRPDNRLCDQKGAAVKCRFASSPRLNNERGQPLGVGCGNYHAMSLNSYTYSKKVSDCFNEIYVATALPNGAILKSYQTAPNRFDPTQDGYIGYYKRFVQYDGVFGNQTALENIIKLYSGFFRPPIVVTWEAFGVSHINASDIVTFSGLDIDTTFPDIPTPANVDGLPKKTATLYLTSVSMEIDPSRNDWRNKYEGEWIYRTCDFTKPTPQETGE